MRLNFNKGENMKILRLLAMSISSVTLALAMSAPSGYVDTLQHCLANKTYQINGKFYAYDFEHDGNIDANDWLYIATDSGKAYRLMGKTPTENDAFGWLPLDQIPQDIDVNNPTGYFIYIDFPQDMELYQTNAFSWVYVTNEKVYKLMGATAQHTFDYLDIDGNGSPDPLPGIIPYIEGESITFTVTPPTITNPSSQSTTLTPPSPF